MRLLFLSLTFCGLVAQATAQSAAHAIGATATESASSDYAGTPLTRELLIGELSRHLSRHFNLEGELQLEFIRPWSPPSRLADTWSVEMLEFPSVASSSMLVRCRVLADGVAAAEWTLVLRATLWRDVWVARQPIPHGSTFDASLLEVRRVDLLRERDALPAAVGDRGYSMARSVTAGRMLTWHDIQRRPLVKKGNVVEVSAAHGQLVITMKALAMENGAAGDTVTVRNPESRKDFAAKVVDENRVQVHF
ncbi:MAG TPA: flagellar basal body P-ring formation chaperone FlgA [Opitutus sp.]|nr:flagellar basal body P-ring formation chaperone FlgA [Opitutus sp.]